MHRSLRRRASAIGVALLLSLTTQSTDARERAPTARPAWRLMIETGRAFGVGGVTPNGAGSTANASGRRRLAADSPVAFELGLLFGAYERPPAAQEPADPFGETSSDTTRRVALIGSYAALTVDLLSGRRGHDLTETGVYFGAVRDRTRFDRATTIERRIGDRFGLSGGVGVRAANGFGLKARYLWVSVPSRPVNVVELLSSIMLF